MDIELQKVKDRLEQLGYTADQTDEVALIFVIEKTEAHIKNNCNVSIIPDGLKIHAIDNICGEYLSQLNSIGKLKDFNIEQALSNIKIGDTTVEYSGKSNTDLFDILITRLISRLEVEIPCYRQIKW